MNAGTGTATHLQPAGSSIAQADDVARRVSVIGIRLALVAVSIQTALYLIDAAVPGSRRLLNADHDGSAYSWMAVTATAVAALAALFIAALLRDRRRRFYPLAALLAFLSLDDMVQIHEELGRLARIPGVDYSERFVWPILYLPILIATFVVLETIARATTEPLRRLIRLGLALLVAAVVLEVAAVALLVDDGLTRLEAVYILEVAVEEAAELAGWIAIATALTAILAARLVCIGSQARLQDEPSREERRA